MQGLGRRREGTRMALAGTLGLHLGPVGLTATRWPSLIESVLSAAAIAALFPLFGLLAANDTGRARRFADAAVAIGGLADRVLPAVCASEGARAEPLVRDRLCPRLELRPMATHGDGMPVPLVAAYAQT